jgi:hypothetical protein
MAKTFSLLNGDGRPSCNEYTEIDITGTSNFTLCAWVKFTTLNSNSPVAVKWGASGGYGLWILSKKFYVNVNDTGSNREAYSASDYDTDTWTHAALVFDGTTRLKINGGLTEDVTGGTVVTGITNVAEIFSVSQYSSGGLAGTRFDGSISDVCMFSRALSNTELQSVMRSGPRMTPGLILWFPLVDGSVSDVNLAPVAGKTAVLGVNTSFTISTTGPPQGSLFGYTRTDFEAPPSSVLSVSKADDLNNWNDVFAQSVPGIAPSDTLALTESQLLGLGLKFPSETLTLSDALAYNFLAPSTPLSVTIVDKIIRNGSINGNNLALRDGIGFVLSPEGPVNIAVSDLGIFLDDSNLGLGYGLAVAD